MDEIAINRTLSFSPYERDLTPEEIAYRKTLAAGIEEVLGGGAETLEALTSGLNSRKVIASDGKQWTEASLEKELRRLAW